MKRVGIMLTLMVGFSGCAAAGKSTADGLPPVPTAGLKLGIPERAQAQPPETFQDEIRRRASQALMSIGATAEQKMRIDELLRSSSKALYDCTGGRERILLKTLSILAASENQAQVLEGLEKADIPFSDHCLMLGSDLMTQFSETLTPQQRQSLRVAWQRDNTGSQP